MRILILSCYPEALSVYLTGAGHEVLECMSVDLAERMLEKYNPDVALFFEDVREVPPVTHRDALKCLVPRTRVIIVAQKSSTLVPYAAALGVRDFIFLPVDPAGILYSIENPASPEQAAETLRKGGVRAEACQDTDLSLSDKSKRSNIKRSNILDKLSNLFTRQEDKLKGIMFIKQGEIVKTDWQPTELLSKEYDAVIMPSSWGVKAVREIRRDTRFRAIPIIVLKGNRDFLRAGADICVKKINPKIIEEAGFLSRRYREFWEKAEFDSLTGIYKKDFLIEWISEQEKRLEPSFSVSMIDIDYFKKFNDTYGHQAGDAVLAQFGSFLASQIRAADIAARYGGEEFVIGLPNTPTAGAQVLVDRLRDKWSRRDIILPSGEKVKCTFSAGVSGYNPGKDVIAEADKYLYKAKNEGRNRVEGVPSKKRKALLLGQKATSLGPQLLEQGLEVATDPADATVAITDVQSFSFAPAELPLVVIGTGTIPILQ